MMDMINFTIGVFLGTLAIILGGGFAILVLMSIGSLIIN